MPGLDWPVVMSQRRLFEIGQRVRHRARPEWGEGVVHTAQAVTTNGRTAQRLTVAFAHHGRVTLNTAHADLELASTTPNSNQTDEPKNTMHSTSRTSDRSADQPRSNGGGWLGRLESATGRGSDNGSLTALPEAATDPFASLSARLKATAELFRFSTEPRSLIDWAVAQTGLDDPLSHYNRHELEEQFRVFDQARQAHLRELLSTARRTSDANADQAIQSLKTHSDPQVRQAIERALRSL